MCPGAVANQVELELINAIPTSGCRVAPKRKGSDCELGLACSKGTPKKQDGIDFWPQETREFHGFWSFARLVSMKTVESGLLEASLRSLAEQSSLLRGSLEPLGSKISLLQPPRQVQDYLGVSAQQLWRAQFGRVIRFLLHMEQQQLMGRKPQAVRAPEHLATQPIRLLRVDFKMAFNRFPDARGGSVLSRAIQKLLELSEDAGGFRQVGTHDIE